MNLNFPSLSQAHVIIRLQKNRSDESQFPKSSPGTCHHSSPKTEAMNLNFRSLPQVHVIIRLQKHRSDELLISLVFPKHMSSFVSKETEAMNLNFLSLSRAHVIIRVQKNRSDESQFPKSFPSTCHHSSPKKQKR